MFQLRKWDKVEGLNQVGSTRPRVKLVVKIKSLPGGVEWAKNGDEGTTEVARNHHQRWWFGLRPAAAGGVPALQVTLGKGGAQGKNGKIVMSMEIKR